MKEHKKVTIYSKPDCMQCKFTKELLDDWNYPYTEINVYEDEAALHYVKEELGFQSLPVVEIEGEVPYFGFRPDRLNPLIGVY